MKKVMNFLRMQLTKETTIKKTLGYSILQVIIIICCFIGGIKLAKQTYDYRLEVQRLERDLTITEKMYERDIAYLSDYIQTLEEK